MLGGMGYQEVATSLANLDEALHLKYQNEFPVTQQCTYLNHAAVAPLCRPAAQAMRELIEDVTSFGALHYDAWLEVYAGVRTAGARLIGCTPEEIAIVKNTSEGISTVALGLDWKPGDRVVGFKEEFPANYFPWARLEARGVEITWLSIHDSLEAIARAMEGARLLAISFVNYLSGDRADLKSLGRLCRAHNCFFFVDAIQGLGALRLNVDECHIDALAADGHKWLLGPEGNGILYVRREWQDRIEPVEFGWTNPARYADYTSRDMTLRPDAGRYECGTLNTVGCYGLRAAIEFILDVGTDEIERTVLARTDQIARGVRRKGYEVLSSRDEGTGSGILTFRHPRVDARTIVSELKRRSILAAPRQGWVRSAPHFYIAPSEIDRMIDILPE